MVDYINYFKTPWVKRDSEDSDIKRGGLLLTDSESLYFVDNKEKLYFSVLAEDGDTWDDDSASLLLYNLSHNEYIVNTNPFHNIIYNSLENDVSSIIGYYMSFLQTKPVDSQTQRREYGSKSNYFIIPFSNGSYYNMYSDYSSHMIWSYIEEATQFIGYYNLFNWHSFPCRYIWEDTISSKTAYKIYNWIGDYDLQIKDINGLLWVRKSECVMNELFFNNEELFVDSLWFLEETKLHQTNQLSYTIEVENGIPSGTQIEVY